MTDSRDPSRQELSHRAKWAALIGITLALVLLLLLAAEIAIRIRQTAKYGTTASPEQLYVVDPVLGLRVPRPSLVAGPITTNKLGFRGPDIALPKPAGTLRIGFLGASTTWCAEVSGNDAVWPHVVVERISSALPDYAFDYVNGGVPGYTVRSSIRNLEFRVGPLNPDVIVIYHAANDVAWELRELAVRQGLIREQAFQEFSWPGRYSVLWNLVEKNLRIMAAEQSARRTAGKLILERASMGQRFRTDLMVLVASAQQNAKLVAVATFATQLRRNQDPEARSRAMASARFYMPFASPEDLLTAYERYNEIIRDVARQTGALLVEGEDRIPGDPAHFVDTVHFTDAGSRAMGERVSRALLASTAFRDLLPGTKRE